MELEYLCHAVLQTFSVHLLKHAIYQPEMVGQTLIEKISFVKRKERAFRNNG